MMAYPTCRLMKGFKIPGTSKISGLVDYAFLATVAYENIGATELALSNWFGPDKVVNQHEFVSQYRVDTHTASIPVFFKLFSFPEILGFGLVSIHGSEMNWD